MKLTRRQVLGSAGLAASGALLAAGPLGIALAGTRGDRAAPGHPPASSVGAASLFRDALIWDNHSGFDPRPDFDLEHLEDWTRAGVNYLSINVGYDVIDWQLAVRNLASYIAWLERRPDRFVLVRHASDILEAKRTGKLAVTFDLEGMGALNGEAAMVSLYYRLGVRQMLIAYNRNNLAGGGCHDEDHGLTEFGRGVIAEMNRVGMMVDCSHTGHRTTMEVMEMATHPVIFSHSNPKGLRAHGRNIADDQIRACARTGGVIGVNGIGLFLADRNATTATMVDCIEYVRNLVGADHVGIGLDYSPPSLDEALNDQLASHEDYWPASEYAGQGPSHDASPSQIRDIATMLLARGWSEPDARKVLGGNFLRVAHAVWK